MANIKIFFFKLCVRRTYKKQLGARLWRHSNKKEMSFKFEMDLRSPLIQTVFLATNWQEPNYLPEASTFATVESLPMLARAGQGFRFYFNKEFTLKYFPNSLCHFSYSRSQICNVYVHKTDSLLCSTKYQRLPSKWIFFWKLIFIFSLHRQRQVEKKQNFHATSLSLLSFLKPWYFIKNKRR